MNGALRRAKIETMTKGAAVLASGAITMLALHGCGLSVTGAVAELDGGGDATVAWPDPSGGGPVVSDVGGAHVPIDAGPACSSDACGFDVPPGWSLVLFARSVATPCPTGFVTESVVTNVAAGPDACTCSSSSCILTSTPRCDEGTVGTKLDSGSTPTCGQTGASITLNGGNCTRLQARLGRHASINAPLPQGTGACTAAAIPNPAAMTSTAAHVCTSASCADVCGAPRAPGLERCLIAAGDQACPADVPNKTVIGTKASLTCDNCASCTVTATSCSGTISFYSDDACNNVLRTFTANVCADGDTAFQSYKWTGTTNVTCNPSGPPAPKVELEEQRTVCCK